MPSYYHYTSRQFAQDIGCTGQLKPGKSGSVYLTPQRYATGIDAADELALEGKPIEMGIEIDMTGLAATNPVLPLRDSTGAVRRRGGGAEVTVPHSVPIGNPATWISLSEP